MSLVLHPATAAGWPAAAWLRASIAHDAAFGRFQLWLPALAAAGIAIALALPFEPSPWWLAAALVTLLVARALVGRSTAAWLAPALLATAALVAGALGVTVEERWAGTPVLTRPQTVTLEGTVTGVEQRGTGRQSIVLTDLSGTFRGAVPKRVRVSVRGGAPLGVGERVSATARLFPLQGPPYPGGYDPARRMYFDGIGASGFTYGAPKSLAPPPDRSLRAGIWRLRTHIEGRIAAAIPGDGSSFAAALLVGLDGMMDPADVEALRASGLAHILSISGLHMALVAGSVFAAVRFALALVPPLALRYPIRKWAAVAGLSAGTAYLAVSGASVATVRAYIMFAVALLAILTDRPALTMRTVAVAAVLVMLFDPISVAEPSFQMSFSAVIALIGFFEWWSARRIGLTAGRPVTGFLVGLALTSLIAGLATAPASAFHFHRLPPLGLVANLAAMPVVSFVTMPSGVIALAVMPLGLEQVPLIVMDASLSVVLAVAHHVADWSGSAGTTGAIPASSALLAASGLLWLALFTAPWRLAGLGLVAAGLAVAPLAPRYDVLVADDGATVAARGPDGRFALTGKDGGFVASLWLRADGDPRPPGPAVGTGRCDAFGCTLPLKAGTLSVPSSPRAVAEDCNLSIAVVSTEPVARCAAALLVDRPLLVRGGAVAARADASGWTLTSARPYGPVRRWHVPPTVSRD